MLQQTFTWTEANIGLLQSLIDQGLSAGQIAAQLQCSRNAVIGKARRLDIQLAGSKGRHPVKRQQPVQKVSWTEALIDKAVSLWEEGKTVRAIAYEIGCTENALLSLTDRHRTRFPHRRYRSEVHAKSVLKIAKKVKAEEPVFTVPKSFTADSVPFLLPDFPGVEFQYLEPHHCKFPVSNDVGASMLCCGAPRLTGSYCGVHAAVARGRGTESERKATSVGRAW